MEFSTAQELAVQAGILLIVIAFGFYVNQIDRRVKAIKNQLGRLSITFLKIENDLSAIQDSLLVMTLPGSDAESRVAAVRDKRSRVFQFVVKEGQTIQQILRGLELPDIDDDPAFWAANDLQRFGLQEDDAK